MSFLHSGKASASKKKPSAESDEDSDKEDNNDDNNDENNSQDSDGDSDNGSGSGDSDNEGSESGQSDNSDNEEEEEDDEPKSKRRKTVKGKKAKGKKTKAKTSSAKKSSKPKSVSIKSESKIPKIKVVRKFERLEEARKAYKWWEATELPEGINWRRLEHPGVVFTVPYERHDVSLIYDGKPVYLTDEQEEIATFYAGIPDDGPQLGNPKVREVFQANFFEDFQESLGPGHVIKEFKKCDFSLMREHLNLKKTLKKAATDEEKLKKKFEKEVVQLKYGYALIDGRMEKVSLSYLI